MFEKICSTRSQLESLFPIQKNKSLGLDSWFESSPTDFHFN